jgi:hypothetical protein
MHWLNALSTLNVLSFLIIYTLLPVLGPYGFEADAGQGGTMEMHAGSAYDRIVTAGETGRISLKESVILGATLLFSPHLLKGSEYAPKAGEAAASGSLTGFYKDVHRVFPELNGQERDFLKGLSPDLKAIIEQREKEEAMPRNAQ